MFLQWLYACCRLPFSKLGYKVGNGIKAILQAATPRGSDTLFLFRVQHIRCLFFSETSFSISLLVVIVMAGFVCHLSRLARLRARWLGERFASVLWISALVSVCYLLWCFVGSPTIQWRFCPKTSSYRRMIKGMPLKWGGFGSVGNSGAYSCWFAITIACFPAWLLYTCVLSVAHHKTGISSSCFCAFIPTRVTNDHDAIIIFYYNVNFLSEWPS